MYSVDELIDNLDRGSDIDDNNDDHSEAEEDIVRQNENEVEIIEGDSENAQGKDEGETKTEPVKKTRTRSEQPKLNIERLKGPRGLISMEKLFSNIEFLGHGHERQDLDKIMTRLHHWCHRLYPKFTFDDTLEHLEKLGTKKPVITLKKKICMGMMEESEPERMEEDVPIIDEPSQDIINDFDLLLQQETLPVRSATQTEISKTSGGLTEEQKEVIARNRLLAAERRRARLEAQNSQNKTNENSQVFQDSENNISIASENNQSVQESSGNLTEEQKEAIARNRKQAAEKRSARLEKPSPENETEDYSAPLFSSQDFEDITSCDLSLQNSVTPTPEITNSVSSEFDLPVISTSKDLSLSKNSATSEIINNSVFFSI